MYLLSRFACVQVCVRLFIAFLFQLITVFMHSCRMFEQCYREWRHAARFSEDITHLGVNFLKDQGCFRNCAACSGALLRSPAGRAAAAAACTPPEATGNAAGSETDSMGAEATHPSSDAQPSAQRGSEGAPVGTASAGVPTSSSQPPQPSRAWSPPSKGVDAQVKCNAHTREGQRSLPEHARRPWRLAMHCYIAVNSAARSFCLTDFYN